MMLIPVSIPVWRSVVPPPHHLHPYSHPHPYPSGVGYQLLPTNYIPQYFIVRSPQEPRPVLHARETVRWERLHPGWIKINSDASVKSQTAAAGGLGRDHNNGAVVFALSHPLKPRGVVEAEAEALLMCLSHAVERGYTRIWMESDSKLVVDAVNDWPLKPIYCNHIVDKIRRILATSVDQWMCSHIYREGNAAADYLSKLGHEGGAKIWDDPQGIPTELCILAFSDVCGRQCKKIVTM